MPIKGNRLLKAGKALNDAFQQKNIFTAFKIINETSGLYALTTPANMAAFCSWRPNKGDLMIKNMFRKTFIRNTLAKKLSVFTFSFFVIGGLIAITAFSPPRQPGAVLHVPPFNMLHQHDLQLTGAITAFTAAVHLPSVEDTTARVPAAPPLSPHVDALGFFYLEQIPLSYELQRYIYDRSAVLGLEYELVLALIWRESTFRIEAVGVNRNGTRDSGLMQINDVNRDWLLERYGIYNLMDPIQNVDAGTMILADLLSRYGEIYALVAYQFGESGMLRLVRDGADTGAITRQVRTKRDEFRTLRAEVFNYLQSAQSQSGQENSY